MGHPAAVLRRRRGFGSRRAGEVVPGLRPGLWAVTVVRAEARTNFRGCSGNSNSRFPEGMTERKARAKATATAGAAAKADAYFEGAKAFSISLRPSSISSPLTEWGLSGKRRRVTCAPIAVKILADSSTRDQGTHWSGSLLAKRAGVPARSPVWVRFEPGGPMRPPVQAMRPA